MQEVLEVNGVFIRFLSLSDMARTVVVFHLSPGECSVLMSTLEPFSVLWNQNQIDFWNCMQYAKFVKPAFDDFILPTKKYADVILPRGGDNHVAIDLIVQHIRMKLGQHDLRKIYPNVFVIQSTFQVWLNLGSI